MRIGLGLPAAVPGVEGPAIGDGASRGETAGFASLAVLDRLVYDNLDPVSCSAMIPAKELAGTSRWYRDVLGLTVASEEETSTVFRSVDSQVNVYRTDAAGTAQHTLIGWSVDDIEAIVDGLTAKGVSFEQYDMPGLQTDARGIARMGEERGAWFRTRKATS